MAQKIIGEILVLFIVQFLVWRVSNYVELELIHGLDA